MDSVCDMNEIKSISLSDLPTFSKLTQLDITNNCYQTYDECICDLEDHFKKHGGGGIVIDSNCEKIDADMILEFINGNNAFIHETYSNQNKNSFIYKIEQQTSESIKFAKVRKKLEKGGIDSKYLQ